MYLISNNNFFIMKKTAILISMFLFLISGLGVDSVNASGASAIWMSPGTKVVEEVYEEFNVRIIVDARGESLDTVRAEIDFDPAKLEVMYIVPGSVFPNQSPVNTINNETGHVSYGMFKSGDPVTGGPDIFATIWFRGLVSAVSTVSVLETSKLVADGAEKIDVYGLGSTTVTVGNDYVLPVVVEEEVDNPHAPVDADLEREALVYFGAFFGRMPEVANDWETLHCMAYGGCQGDPRNLAAEQGALVTFGAKYAKMPETQVEWNVLHTLAYTDLMLANY
jgi:hypothetical protein